MSKPTVAHIGIALNQLEAALAFYRDVLDIEPGSAESADGANIVPLSMGNVEVELLVPQTPDSPVGRFLARRGPGIHHLCFRVPNLDLALERCHQHGYQLVDQIPRTGTGGRRIAFLHPKTTAGILIELTE